MSTLAVAMQKGGSGKSSLAVHLAVGLAREGRRTVLVDLDVQGNATQWLLGQVPDASTQGAAHALQGEPTQPLEVPGRDGLGVVPATSRLAGVDVNLSAEVGGHQLLAESLAELEADHVVLDCPPSLGLTVVSALWAADAVLVPVLPGYFSLTGLRALEDTMQRVRDRLQGKAEALGYVLFSADAREGTAAEVRELLHRHAPAKLYQAEVRVSAAAKSLPARRATAWEKGEDPRGLEDYRAVLQETMDRLSQRAPAEVETT